MISNESCIFIKFILINKIQISIPILLIDTNQFLLFFTVLTSRKQYKFFDKLCKMEVKIP